MTRGGASALRVAALPLVALLAACPPPRHAGVAGDCEWYAPGEAPAGPSREARPADPELERLLPLRSYLQVLRVGPYRHHFLAWFGCIEPTVLELAVTPLGAPGRQRVELTGGFWGGLGVRPEGDLPAIPPSAQEMASEVRRELAARIPGARDPELRYLGAYREVELVEVVPMGAPGDPMARMTVHARRVVGASEDLTELVSPMAGFSGGITRLCWEDSDYVPCHEPAWWVPLPLPLASTGRPLLRDLDLAAGPEEARALIGAALAVARARVGGGERVALDALPVSRSGTLLPEGIAQVLLLSLTAYARGEAGNVDDGQLVVRLPLSDALAQGATGEARVAVAGVSLTVRASLRALPPAEEAAPGARAFELSLELRDDRGHVHERALVVTGHVLEDGERAATLGLEIDLGQGVHEPPRHMGFAAEGAAPLIDVYIDGSLRTDTW